MYKLFKDNFHKTNDCIILAAPLIVFISILGWYGNYAKDTIDNLPKLIISVITVLIMISGFISAWLYMAKKTLKLTNKVFVFDKDRAKEMCQLIKKLPNGIGRYFLPILFICTTLIALYTIVFAIINYFVTKYIGPINLSTLGITYNFILTDENFNEIMGLPEQEFVAFNCWYILLGIVSLIFSFLGMLWIPEVIYIQRNPIKAFISSLKKVFGNIQNYILLYSYIVILYILACFANTILMLNPFSYVLVLIISYYFIIYVVVLLFSYYERFFISEEN